MPAVSVLLPCRDTGAFLAPAVESVRAQTFEDFEVVAVDDGSTDDTLARLRDWARTDSRVRVLRTGGAGLVAALTAALEAAEAPLVARMDADDVAEPLRLERQVELLAADPGLVACGTLVRYFPRDRLRDGARRYEDWINSLVTPEQIARDIFVECPLPHPTLVARRAALLEVGGYRDLGWPEDYDLVLRLWAAGRRMAKVPEVLYHWRERPDRASRVDRRYGPERFLRLKVRFLRDTLLAGDRAVVVWGAGPTGKTLVRALAEAGTRTAAFVDLDPRKLGQEIHGARVHPPGDVPGLIAGGEGRLIADGEGRLIADGEGRPDRTPPLVLAAVGQAGAREEIRAECRRLGLVEGRDFIAVA
jgi:GT2 family glycosyltransferase